MGERDALACTIVDTAIALAEQRTWEAIRLHEVATTLGITLADVHRRFRDKEDLVDAWFDRADEAMLHAAQVAGFAALPARDRLLRLVMAWLGALAAHRRVTRQMIGGRLEPGHLHIQVPALVRISRTVQWLREAAGRDAALPRRALEEAGLTAIYLAAFCHWMYDDSPGSTRTRDVLDSMLARGEWLEQAMLGRGPA